MVIPAPEVRPVVPETSPVARARPRTLQLLSILWILDGGNLICLVLHYLGKTWIALGSGSRLAIFKWSEGMKLQNWQPSLLITRAPGFPCSPKVGYRYKLAAVYFWGCYPLGSWTRIDCFFRNGLIMLIPRKAVGGKLGLPASTNWLEWDRQMLVSSSATKLATSFHHILSQQTPCCQTRKLEASVDFVLGRPWNHAQKPP